ncbi:hypothetical protein K443DRAFT_12954 [Laccaria amethystina LaAM-08-1]|uniref:Uncharacterized protein n=1 Tax=Laccaria amethystina LaAM-08-1 TaxID=1095629 RepID=A0A0C9XAK7_9AGAR|nr:hypothetical protein K443DRAFT_12954 [Laccaria amethystina LaAM-08-1]
MDSIWNNPGRVKYCTPPKDKSKKRAAPGSKATAKAKRAETVSIPYDAVPGMNINSREFRKAILVENAKVGNPNGKHACTEPPFIGGLAELQSLQSEAGHPLVINNPLY